MKTTGAAWKDRVVKCVTARMRKESSSCLETRARTFCSQGDLGSYRVGLLGSGEPELLAGQWTPLLQPRCPPQTFLSTTCSACGVTPSLPVFCCSWLAKPR